jgi:hypothetical protein
MRRALCTIVTTWPFVVSLLVLLANDAWLKAVHPGLVSGKLSDFAGIAIVSLLLLAALPNRRPIVVAAVVGGFAWWKSPLAQPAIDAINLQLPLPIGRTVDYTDLVAFLVIPLCAVVAARPGAFAIPNASLRRVLLAPIAALTLLGLMATSVMQTRQDYQVRAARPTTGFDRAAIAETVSQVAAQHGLACEDCSDRVTRARFNGRGISLWYVFIEPKAISFEVSAIPEGFFFGPSGQQRADRLRNDLKSRLAAAYKDLEYVEPLGAKEERNGVPGGSWNPPKE